MNYYICPKCGELAYENTTMTFSVENPPTHYMCHCQACNYENEREAYPIEPQPLILSPELEKIKEFKEALASIHSDITNLHGEMVKVFRSSASTARNETE